VLRLPALRFAPPGLDHLPHDRAAFLGSRAGPSRGLSLSCRGLASAPAELDSGRILPFRHGRILTSRPVLTPLLTYVYRYMYDAERSKGGISGRLAPALDSPGSEGVAQVMEPEVLQPGRLQAH
jgi:hypothetical protein